MESSLYQIFCGWCSGFGASIQETCSAGSRLRDNAVSGTQIEPQIELRAPSAHHAAYYLDAAIAARTVPGWFLIIFSRSPFYNNIIKQVLLDLRIRQLV